MLDFLVALGQFVCFLGLLYGAFLCLAHPERTDTLSTKYDPLSGHEWGDKPPAARSIRSGKRAAMSVPWRERSVVLEFINPPLPGRELSRSG